MWPWRSSESSRARVAEALLGLGGNLGDPAAAIRGALARLAEAGAPVRAQSHLYRTSAWGPVAQPDFINACAAVETALAPLPLLGLCQRVERELGRERSLRWGPRTLDIDILAYEDLELDEPGLTLPHPRLFERAFVLVPLAEIAPDRLIAGRTVRDWSAGLDPAGVARLD